MAVNRPACVGNGENFKHSLLDKLFDPQGDPYISNAQLIFSQKRADCMGFLKLVRLGVQFSKNKAVIDGFRGALESAIE